MAFHGIIVIAAAICCSPIQSGFAFRLSWPKQFTASQADSCCCLEQRERVVSFLSKEIYNHIMIVPQCGDGIWYRVASLNMSDAMHMCPSNWTEIINPVRTCGRPTRVGVPSCPGVFFSTQSLQYSKVCGRAIGFQDGSTDGFFRIRINSSVDDYYVDGLSVTHGSVPRTHIWTYAVGAVDSSVLSYVTNCPCAAQPGTSQPSFVGNNYFCESGNHGAGLGSRTEFLQDDPVWDGQQCEGECCNNGKSPPWFSVTLANPTTDDIEVRICGDEGTDNEDTPLQLLEIYIQ